MKSAQPSNQPPTRPVDNERSVADTLTHLVLAVALIALVAAAIYIARNGVPFH